MNELRYVFDPGRSMLIVFEGKRNVGGFIGKIAEREFEKLLLTDARIELGKVISKSDKSHSKSL